MYANEKYLSDFRGVCFKLYLKIPGNMIAEKIYFYVCFKILFLGIEVS